MKEHFKGKRFAYVKSSNAAEELKQVSASLSSFSDGPLTFLCQFLALFRGEKIMLLSFGSASASYSSGSCVAIAYKRRLLFMGGLGAVCSEIRRFVLVLFHLLRFRPDYILCASYRQSLWASYLAAKILNCTLVHSRHNSMQSAKGLRQKIIWAIDRAVIGRIQIICHGTYLKEQLLKIGVPARQVSEFQPGYRSFYENAIADNSSFRDISDNGRRTIIGFVGRIVSEKGVFDLLKACFARMQQDVNLTLLYVGTGSAVEELRQQSRTLKLEKQVVTLGQIPHSQLGGIIRQCRFVVTPTRSVFPEGFGMAALEPMVVGKPVIVPDFGPFPSFVHDGGNGLFFEVDSVESLTGAINRMLDDRDLYVKLSEGAQATGAAALDPSVTFSAALEHAFSAW